MLQRQKARTCSHLLSFCRPQGCLKINLAVLQELLWPEINKGCKRENTWGICPPDLAWFGHQCLWKPFKGLTGAFGFHIENLGGLLLNELILLALKSWKPVHLPSSCDSLFPWVMAFSVSNVTSNWCSDKHFTFLLFFVWRDTCLSQLHHRGCTVFST